MGMYAKVSEGWHDLGTYLAIVSTVLVTIGILTKSRPGRWVARKLVGEPVRDWVRNEAVAPLLAMHEERVTTTIESAVTKVIHGHTDQEETLAKELVHIVGGLDAKVDSLVNEMERLKKAG